MEFSGKTRRKLQKRYLVVQDERCTIERDPQHVDVPPNLLIQIRHFVGGICAQIAIIQVLQGPATISEKNKRNTDMVGTTIQVAWTQR